MSALMLNIADTAIRTDADGRFSLNDLHRAAGGEKRHGPSYWLETGQAKDLAQELTDTGNPVSPVSSIRGGLEQGTYVVKELVYAYAMWISPAFHLKVIRAYDALVTKPRLELSRMDILKLAMESEQRAIALEGEKRQLEGKIEADAPKVAFHDAVAVASGAITLGEAAKILGTGRTRLMTWLRQIAWLRRNNEPYQDKIEAGLLDVKLGTWDHPEYGMQRSVTALVTGKGLARLQRLWQESSLRQPKAKMNGTTGTFLDS